MKHMSGPEVLQFLQDNPAWILQWCQGSGPNSSWYWLRKGESSTETIALDGRRISSWLRANPHHFDKRESFHCLNYRLTATPFAPEPLPAKRRSKCRRV